MRVSILATLLLTGTSLAACGVSAPAMPFADDGTTAPAQSLPTALAVEESSPTLARTQPFPAGTPVEESSPTPQHTQAASNAMSVKVTSVTKSVNAGAHASVTIVTTKKAECGITVEYDSGPSKAQGLAVKTADASGKVTWTWAVGIRTAMGTYPISVECTLGDRIGTAETTFSVK